eukprot:3936419-Rhodomonas_salina.1
MVAAPECSRPVVGVHLLAPCTPRFCVGSTYVTTRRADGELCEPLVQLQGGGVVLCYPQRRAWLHVNKETGLIGAIQVARDDASGGFVRYLLDADLRVTEIVDARSADNALCVRFEGGVAVSVSSTGPQFGDWRQGDPAPCARLVWRAVPSSGVEPFGVRCTAGERVIDCGASGGSGSPFNR